MAALKSMTVWRRWASVLAVFVAILLVVEFLELTFLVANALYQLEGGQWSLRHHFITETILHDGIRKLNLAFVVLVLALTVAACTKGKASGAGMYCYSYRFCCLWFSELPQGDACMTVLGICSYTEELKPYQFMVVQRHSFGSSCFPSDIQGLCLDCSVLFLA